MPSSNLPTNQSAFLYKNTSQFRSNPVKLSEQQRGGHPATIRQAHGKRGGHFTKYDFHGILFLVPIATKGVLMHHLPTLISEIVLESNTRITSEELLAQIRKYFPTCSKEQTETALKNMAADPRYEALLDRVSIGS